MQKHLDLLSVVIFDIWLMTLFLLLGRRITSFSVALGCGHGNRIVSKTDQIRSHVNNPASNIRQSHTETRERRKFDAPALISPVRAILFYPPVFPPAQ